MCLRWHESTPPRVGQENEPRYGAPAVVVADSGGYAVDISPESADSDDATVLGGNTHSVTTHSCTHAPFVTVTAPESPFHFTKRVRVERARRFDGTPYCGVVSWHSNSVSRSSHRRYADAPVEHGHGPWSRRAVGAALSYCERPNAPDRRPTCRVFYVCRIA